MASDVYYYDRIHENNVKTRDLLENLAAPPHMKAEAYELAKLLREMDVKDDLQREAIQARLNALLLSMIALIYEPEPAGVELGSVDT